MKTKLIACKSFHKLRLEPSTTLYNNLQLSLGTSLEKSQIHKAFDQNFYI